MWRIWSELICTQIPPGSPTSIRSILRLRWGQCIEGFCHSIFLLLACLWWRALNHVYSGAGSKRGQPHNWMGRLAAALLWGKHHHTPRNQNKDTEGGKRKSARIKEIVIPPILFCRNAFDRKHFLNTTGLLLKKGSLSKAFQSGRRASGSLHRGSKIFCVGWKIFLQAIKLCVYRSFRFQSGLFRFPPSGNSILRAFYGTFWGD